jgi:HrpA-like RNA helicase
MDFVSDLRDYQVESDDVDQQASIEFSRALFQLDNVSHWLEEEEDLEHGHGHGSLEGSTSSKNGDGDSDSDDVVMNYVKALDQTLMQLAEADFEERTVCIKSQIMAPFEQGLFDDPDLEQLLRETLDVMMGSQSLAYDARTIPPGLSWDDFMLAEIFQRSILATLKRRLVDAEGLEVDQVPSMIFDHFSFYHALAARNRSMAEMDDPEPTIASEIPSICESKHVRKSLPIDEHKVDILRSIQNNRVTIIQGETGCGKSSRVPVMLLEAPPPDPSSSKVKIFICQPRRIAAKSLTERVRSTEPHLKDSIALRMGHGVREYETKHTKAWFVTTGYLVRYLANNIEAFDNVTHLVIDEVHERSIDSDIICLLAKRLLQTNPNIRLVLMSATVAAKLYQDYFDVTQPPIFVGVRCHPIQEYFSEDIGKQLKLGPKERKVLSGISEICAKTRCQVAPNAHYIATLQHMAVQIAVEVGRLGSSVLIFVPGMADIVAISERFEEMVSTINYTIIPIHSDIPFEDQMTAFDLTDSKEVKVIVATNAAESSITLPDVDNVICFGLCKAITYNKQSHRQVLETSWISKANATQRAGRTGRVRPGNVFRLYPKMAFDRFFRPFEEGEILRCPLDSVILNLRTIVQDESVSELLKECIEPPDLVNIENSFFSLHKKNFITEATDQFAITPLGELVVALGIDLSIAALVGFGIRLGLLSETIELAAILSFPKSPWLLPNPLLQDPEVYNGKFLLKPTKNCMSIKLKSQTQSRDCFEDIRLQSKI